MKGSKLAVVPTLLSALVLWQCSRPKPVVAPPVTRPTPAATPAPATPGTMEVRPEPGVQPAARPEGELTSEQLPQDVEAINRAGFLKDVFFDTDKFDLTEDARQALAANAAWLKAHPSVKFLLEGHCDERNTNEYNLALGWKRANAVKDYLVSLGIREERIATISYGEERPFATCHEESCWWQNRRVHFVVTAR